MGMSSLTDEQLIEELHKRNPFAGYRDWLPLEGDDRKVLLDTLARYHEREGERRSMSHSDIPEWPAFRCRDCGADFDELGKSDDNDDKPRCPNCGSCDLVDHRS